MPTRNAPAFEAFEAQYGYTVTNALMVYSDRMRKDADAIQAEYDRIKDDQEAQARQDASMVTTAGLLHSARAIREAADQADAAREAWEALTEGDDEDGS